MSRTNAEAELRQHFGARYDAQAAAARGLVQRAAQRCPEIVGFLERTGVGNDPEFVRKLAAAAAVRDDGGDLIQPGRWRWLLRLWLVGVISFRLAPFAIAWNWRRDRLGPSWVWCLRIAGHQSAILRLGG